MEHQSQRNMWGSIPQPFLLSCTFINCKYLEVVFLVLVQKNSNTHILNKS